MTGFTYQDLAHTLGPPVSKGASFMCFCPSHDDPTPSLHVSEGRDGGVIVNCHAKCDKTAVWAACLSVMGGRKPAITPRATGTAARTKLVSVYPMPEPAAGDIRHRDLGTPSRMWEYRDATNALHFIICRFETEHGKEFRPYTYKYNADKGSKYYSWTGPDRGRIMYRLNNLADKGPVLVVEGEKAADAAAILLPEVSAVAASGGVKNWRYTDWAPLAGRVVWLWPDNDAPGLAGMSELAAHLMKLGCTVILASSVAFAVTECDTPTDKIKGFDAADALELGWDHARTISFLDMAQCESAQIGTLENANPHGENANPQSQNANPQCESAENSANPHESAADLQNGVADLHKTDADSPNSTADLHANLADSQKTNANPQPAPSAFADSLAKSLKQQAIAGFPFLPLGFDGENYYYLSKRTKQVKCISTPNLKKNFFLSMVPETSFWEGFAAPKKSGPDWDQVTSKLITLCHDAGLFELDMIRGRGAWYDNGHTVLHLGNRLIIDGNTADILTRPGRFVYELSTPMEGPGDKPMPDSEASALLAIAHEFSWERPISAMYLAGWVAMAPICGALAWRPHVWLTGAKGTGKSTIEERFIRPLLGNMALIAQGNSTEAGIRQRLNHDAIPVLIDESESEDDKGRTRMEGIIQMMRQASSDGSALTIKGGATGKATTYNIRSMFALASIGVNIRRAADGSRITKLPLKKTTNDWRTLERQLETITEDTARRLIARTVSLIPVIRKNAKTLAAAIAKIMGGDQRFGDQYGSLLAGAVSLIHSEVITPQDAESFVAGYASEFSRQSDDIGPDDQVQCLEHLLQQTIRMERSTGGGQPVTLSVAELVQIARHGKTVHGDGTFNQTDAYAVLLRHGIKAEPRHKSDMVKIARTHAQLATLFRGTPWQAGWHQFLVRLEGAGTPVSENGKDAKVRFGGPAVNAIEVPAELMEGGADPVAADEPF